MDAVRRTFEQFLDLFKSMSPSQRGTLIIVPLMIVVALGFVMFGEKSSSYVALSWGKVFSTEEIMNVEQTLIDAGLNEFLRKGQRLMVPKSQIERYNAALLEGGTLPDDWASEWEKQLEKSSVFSSKQQLEQIKEISRAKLISRMIRAVPEIEHADVIWARGTSRSRWSKKPKVTATVNVRPRRGRQLSMQLVQSLQASVASMVPDLESADVTIFNQIEGKSYTQDKDGEPFNSKLLSRIHEFEQSYQGAIGEALSYIPSVLVSVNVDVDNLKRSVERKTTYDPKGAVPLRTTEQTTNRSSSQQPNAAEPGTVPNQPRQLQTAGGSVKQQTVTETNLDTVNVPSVTITEQELSAAMPKAVQVSISIPEDYYKAVALKQGLTAGETDQEKAEFQTSIATIKTEVETNVKNTVAKLIPANSQPEAINVNSFVSVNTEPPPVALPWTETIGGVISQWGSGIGLTLFALWALWMLNKSMSKVQTIDPITTSVSPKREVGDEFEEEEEEEEQKPQAPSRRDILQGTVHDNPELAAAVISKWIQSSD